VSAYRAQYSDGLTAASSTVLAVTDADGIAITNEDGGTIDHWAWADIRLSEPASPSRPIRLGSRTREDARLAIEDQAALAELKAHARYLAREPFDRARIRTIAGITGICVAIGLFFVYGLPLVVRPIATLIPVDWEKPIGENTVAIINKLFADGRPLCNSAAGVDALKKLSGKLSATYDTPYDIRVDVADSSIVNALATPGGRILVFRGLIAKAKAPDEVAGVLAHEMAHVINRHPTQGMINSIGWSSLMSIFTGGATLSNEAMARFAAHLATSAYTRDLEAEADAGAVNMVTGSGIGTDGLANFFRTIQKEEIKGLTLPPYLATHPQTEDRIKAIEGKKSAAKAPALSDAEWKALRDICK